MMFLKKQFCYFTVNDGTLVNRENGLWAFDIKRLDVKLNCCPSDRCQNFLIRGNHLPVANGLSYATSLGHERRKEIHLPIF